MTSAYSRSTARLRRLARRPECQRAPYFEQTTCRLAGILPLRWSRFSSYQLLVLAGAGHPTRRSRSGPSISNDDRAVNAGIVGDEPRGYPQRAHDPDADPLVLVLAFCLSKPNGSLRMQLLSGYVECF